jgi:stage V sporulation protein SpoVS
MKSRKLIVFTLIMFFALSTLAFMAEGLVECPRCHGSGQITSQTCIACYGSGVIQPKVTKVRLLVGKSPTQTNVSGIFHNSENVEVYGVATATVNTQVKILTGASNRTLLPPNSDVMITVSFDKLTYEGYYASMIDLTVEQIACPACSGSGAGSVVDCPDCDGTGYITEGAIVGLDFAGVGVPVIGVAVVTAVAGVGLFVVKKRRLTEQKVRSFTSFEFQKWVLGRLKGTGASVLDARKGIDGFTGDGTPIVAKQSDNVGKVQVDGFLNSVMQAKAKSGIMVAFGFDKEASAAVIRGRMNYHVAVKLVTVKELLERKEMVLL